MSDTPTPPLKFKFNNKHEETQTKPTKDSNLIPVLRSHKEKKTAGIA